MNNKKKEGVGEQEGQDQEKDQASPDRFVRSLASPCRSDVFIGLAQGSVFPEGYVPRGSL